MSQQRQNSFEELVQVFTNRITELQEQMLLRSSDVSQSIHQQDLRELKARIHAIQNALIQIRQFVQNERESLSRFRDALRPLKIENQFLKHMVENLPERMPEQNNNFFDTNFDQNSNACINNNQLIQNQNYLNQQKQQFNYLSNNINNMQQNSDFNNVSQYNLNSQIQNGADNYNQVLYYDSSQVESEAENQQQQKQLYQKQRNIEKIQKQPPKNYLTVDEFQNIPQYMRGRLTRDKLNAALEDLIEFSLQNQKLMQQIKNNSVRLSQTERNRATELYYNVANKNKGKFWFCEVDLRGGKTIKLDKTGKSILTIFRHLGRLQEVRVSIMGAQTHVFLLL